MTDLKVRQMLCHLCNDYLEDSRVDCSVCLTCEGC